MKAALILFAGLLLGAVVAEAAAPGAQFLKIDTEARLSGMASAGVASVYGIGALNYNPAGLSSINGSEAAFSHSKWLMDSSHDFAGFGVKAGSFMGESLAIGVGVARLSNGSFDGRGEDRGASGGYGAYDQVVSFGAAVRGVGFAVKYIDSSIAGVRAETFAVDLGARHKLSGLPVTFGFGVQNLGRGLKYISQRDRLPLSVNAGISFAILSGVGVAVDAKRLVYDRQTVLSAGTEYSMQTGGGVGFALRGGYGLAGMSSADAKSGLSAGAGVRALGAEVDYAVSPETGLGSVQRITLKKRF